MLRELHISNYALIEDLVIDFGPGLNVLTGETGAGKSIILDAMACILGERASSEAIRTGCDRATLEALFDIADNQPVQSMLEELGFDGGNELLIVREISASGRNRCRVNGRLATVSILQQLGRHLVELHSQHEHQQILAESTHLDILDEFTGTVSEREAVAELFARLKDATRQLEQLRASERERIQKLDMLNYQVEEIDGANLAAGEEEELQKEKRVLANAQELQQMTEKAYALLYAGEQFSASDLAGEAVSVLEDLVELDDRLATLVELVQGAVYQLEEAAHELRKYRDGIEVDPERLSEVEERLTLIGELKRKYGDSIAEILAFRKEAAVQIEQLQNSVTEADQLEEQIQAIQSELARKADVLSKKRKAGAGRLARTVEKELAGLNMGDTRFRVEFMPANSRFTAPRENRQVPVASYGFEQARFLISPNPGEELKPLVKIASGGETSRIVLVLKSIVARDAALTLIFDEIDTGIGGQTAEAVAERLAKLAAGQQVLCVTHLPVVAAKAQVHYHISKEVSSGRTRARVERLSGEKRLQELVRMLGGSKDNEVTRRHAALLLEGEAQ